MVLEQYIPNPYFRGLLLFIVTFMFLKISFSILERVALKLSSKTKTDLDDVILRKSSRPINFFLFLVSFQIIFREIPLSGNISNVLSQITSSLIIITLGYLLYILVDLSLLRILKNFSSKTKTTLDDNLASLVHSILKASLGVIVLLYILSVWGIEILPLLGALGIAGLAVALALQPTLSNIFSGVSMVFDKTVSVGDLVYLDKDTKGKIVKIGLRSTKISTFDNELVIVPNSKLADSTIHNVTLPEPKSRAVVPFSVAYGSDIEEVKKVVLKEIKTVKHVIKEPEPLVRFLEMADSSLNFKVYYYVDSYQNRFSSIDEANTKIYNALNKNKINIPFPQLDVHLRKK